MSPTARRRALLAAALPLLVGACGAPDADRASATITAADISRLTRTLASDDFAGRGPGGRGEATTIGFLQGELDRIGVEPFGDADADGNRTWLQRVPVAEITVDAATAALRMPRSGGGRSAGSARRVDLR